MDVGQVNVDLRCRGRRAVGVVAGAIFRRIPRRRRCLGFRPGQRILPRNVQPRLVRRIQEALGTDADDADGQHDASGQGQREGLEVGPDPACCAAVGRSGLGLKENNGRAEAGGHPRHGGEEEGRPAVGGGHGYYSSRLLWLCWLGGHLFDDDDLTT